MYSKSLDKINIYTQIKSYIFGIISCLIIFYYFLFVNDKNDDFTNLFTISIIFISFFIALLYILSTLFYVYTKILNFNINFIYSKFIEKSIFNTMKYVNETNISYNNLNFLKKLKVLNILNDTHIY